MVVVSEIRSVKDKLSNFAPVSHFARGYSNSFSKVYIYIGKILDKVCPSSEISYHTQIDISDDEYFLSDSDED